MSENDENAPKEKRSFFGFRRTNKIEKAKNIPEVISRILTIPKDNIIVNNKAYADKKEKERKEKEKQQKDQEANDKFNEYLKNTRDGTSEGNQTNDLNTDSSSGPSDSSGDPTQSTTGTSEIEGTTTPSETTSHDESSSKKAPSKALPIISSFQFDPSIGEEQQTKIKNIMSNLNNMLRLPELGLFADDEIQGKTDSVITVEKIIDDDGEKQNPPKEIYIEPLIQIVE